MAIRGAWGIICGITLYLLFSLYATSYSMLYGIFGEHYPYFTWIYLPILYPITIVMVRFFADTGRKYDLYFRGFSLYFTLAVLTYVVLSSV